MNAMLGIASRLLLMFRDVARNRKLSGSVAVSERRRVGRHLFSSARNRICHRHTDKQQRRQRDTRELQQCLEGGSESHDNQGSTEIG